MSSFLTVLLPGLAQMQTGQWRKAATMFLVALFLGPPTGGIGWLFSGLWSLMDAKGSFTGQPAASPPPPDNSADRRASSDPPASKGSVAPWVFKFAVLGVGASIAFYSISKGRALETLKFVGLELSFASSVGQLANGEPSPDPVTTADVMTDNPASAFAPSDDPKASLAPDNSSATSTSSSITGSWKGSTGSTYGITEVGSMVTVIETSNLLGFIPVETGRCDGSVSNGEVTAPCIMSNGVMGMMTLSRSSDGNTLVGKFKEQTTGYELPLMLER